MNKTACYAYNEYHQRQSIWTEIVDYKQLIAINIHIETTKLRKFRIDPFAVVFSAKIFSRSISYSLFMQLIPWRCVCCTFFHNRKVFIDN